MAPGRPINETEFSIDNDHSRYIMNAFEEEKLLEMNFWRCREKETWNCSYRRNKREPEELDNHDITDCFRNELVPTWQEQLGKEREIVQVTYTRGSFGDETELVVKIIDRKINAQYYLVKESEAEEMKVEGLVKISQT